MKTILTRTAIAALAVASFGFAACTAGVEAKPQDAPIKTGSSQQAPAQTDSPAPQQAESEDNSSSETRNVSGGVTAPGVTVGPGGISAPGVTIGSGGVTASAGGIRSADCEKDSVVEETGTVVNS